MKLTLYTQNACGYCHIMEQKLNEWDVPYETINISYDNKAKSFLKSKNVKTVPQLFLGDFHINKGIDTKDFTVLSLYVNITKAFEKYFDNELLVWWHNESKNI